MYRLVAEPTPQGGDEGPVLLHSLSGFLDAGYVGRLATAHLLETLDHRLVAEFDLDEVFDYRARRPRLTFRADHFADVDMPRLLIEELTDSAGRTFLLMHGPEPDLAWQRFVAAIEQLAHRWNVSLAVGMHAIPWPAPHTRPVGITAHASDRSLVADHRPWVGELQVPGHLTALLELMLGRAGHRAMGFAVHVPHYLAESAYPRAAVALLDSVARATGLSLPTAELRTAADAADIEIAEQVDSAPENEAAVRSLEAQYDAQLAAREVEEAAQALAGDSGEGDAPFDPEQMPSAEELAAAVEQFLADMDDDGRDGRDGR
jgi:predicted ATP-grasp superfamily ATP-dependent carboligase